MTNLLGRRILIVEDEIMIALLLQDILQEFGYVVAGIATRSEEALRLIEASAGTLDAATLDVNLGGITSHDIAAMLDARGIPFIITTGYADAPHLVGFGDRPTVHKPYDTHDVGRALGLLRWPE